MDLNLGGININLNLLALLLEFTEFTGSHFPTSLAAFHTRALYTGTYVPKSIAGRIIEGLKKYSPKPVGIRLLYHGYYSQFIWYIASFTVSG